MTRQSKQGERRARSPKRPRGPAIKTGSKKDNLPNGFKEHVNAIAGKLAKTMFISKIR